MRCRKADTSHCIFNQTLNWPRDCEALSSCACKQSSQTCSSFSIGLNPSVVHFQSWYFRYMKPRPVLSTLTMCPRESKSNAALRDGKCCICCAFVVHFLMCYFQHSDAIVFLYHCITYHVLPPCVEPLLMSNKTSSACRYSLVVEATA